MIHRKLKKKHNNIVITNGLAILRDGLTIRLSVFMRYMNQAEDICFINVAESPDMAPTIFIANNTQKWLIPKELMPDYQNWDIQHSVRPIENLFISPSFIIN